MRVIILGSAAGGGSPQWNCNCNVCRLHWSGDARVRRRTQSSLAVSADGESWSLLNCSPDVLEQIQATPQLHPNAHVRHSPIKSIILTNGDIDHIGGLLSLREKQPLAIYAAANVLRQLTENPVFGVLDRSVVNFCEVHPKVPFSPLPGLDMELFAVPGKVPLYREGDETPMIGRDGNTSGLHVRHSEQVMSYVPGCGEIDAQLLDDLAETQTLLFDGTLFTDDEMIRNGTGQKTGKRMGHVSVSGEEGSIADLAPLKAKRRIFIHMNNTNPLLVDGSAEKAHAESRGWEIGFDGLELAL